MQQTPDEYSLLFSWIEHILNKSSWLNDQNDVFCFHNISYKEYFWRKHLAMNSTNVPCDSQLNKIQAAKIVHGLRREPSQPWFLTWHTHVLRGHLVATCGQIYSISHWTNDIIVHLLWGEINELSTSGVNVAETELMVYSWSIRDLLE